MIAAAFAFFLVISPAAAADRPVRIVAFGDSLMAGYELPAADTFTAQLDRALKAKGVAAIVENAAVSGDTSSGGAARLDWSVPDGTDAVLLELGANDMLRGIDPGVTFQMLDGIIARLKARGIDVLLCGMQAAPNLGAEYANALNAIYPALAKKHDLIFYPFFLEGVATKQALLLRDGIHPNAAGVGTIVAGIVP
ncbi:MAG: arylesterase, partial [Pseudorhodoplanes sp.]|nr:arylesterase [Pseudorhodoplanes sp.]